MLGGQPNKSWRSNYVKGGNITDKVKSNPHFILFLLPIIVYGLLALYSKFITKSVGLKAYSIFVYISFILLLIGYSRYCASKMVEGSEMIFMISAYLMITSVMALCFFLFKIITFSEDKTDDNKK
jgi:heme/copper-type cytochrome/quinol oxidase subunit 3